MIIPKKRGSNNPNQSSTKHNLSVVSTFTAYIPTIVGGFNAWLQSRIIINQAGFSSHCHLLPPTALGVFLLLPGWKNMKLHVAVCLITNWIYEMDLSLAIGSMVLLYMVLHGSHQYTPFMLAYIPAPWIRHGLLSCSSFSGMQWIYGNGWCILGVLNTRGMALRISHWMNKNPTSCKVSKSGYTPCFFFESFKCARVFMVYRMVSTLSTLYMYVCICMYIYIYILTHTYIV